MRLIIAGSRNATAADVRRALHEFSWTTLATCVISGTAHGADELGERWAEERGLEIRRFPADWKTHGKRAGPLRNGIMAQNADALVAVWDGKSRGTMSMIELARKQGLRIGIYRTDQRAILEEAPKYKFLDAWEQLEELAAKFEFDASMTRECAEQLALELYSAGSMRQTVGNSPTSDA